MPDRVAELRAFNRFYTRRIGALQGGFLGTTYALPDARVLYELAEPTEVRDLRSALDIDAGFLSRVLSRLEAAGRIERHPSPSDRRRQTVALTATGHADRAELDARSVAANEALIGELDPATREGVLDAMRLIQTALEPQGEVTLRKPAPGDLGWIVARHGDLYAREYDFNERFERLVAKVITQYEAVWIAEVGGAKAGCVMCVREDARTARLRLLLVEPWARGLGVGSRLIDACMEHARDAGYERMVLWTNDVLPDARRLYDRRGFTLVEEEPHARFGPPMVGQTLARDL